MDYFSHHNIILIGMPGSGKSTLGVQLAKELGLNFIDTDLLIQNRQHHKLQYLLEQHGYLGLRAMEEQELLQLQLKNDLVATGGSAVYSDKAMKHLKQQGVIIYLQVGFESIRKRIDNENSRGIAKPSEHSLLDVYRERIPLYEKYADITINNEQIMSPNTLIKQLQSYPEFMSHDE